MFYFVRKHQITFGLLLTAVFSCYIAGCSIYKRSEVDAEKALEMAKKPLHFYVLDDTFPEEFAWLVDAPVLHQTSLEGRLVRLSNLEAINVNRHSGNPDAKRSRNHVVFYVRNAYAQTLFDSTRVHLAFGEVTRTEIYELAPGKSAIATTFVVIGGAFTAMLLVVVVAATLGATSCPFVYAENPDGEILEGEPYVGATHPQLERHDWLPLPHLKADGDVYRLRIANEAAEIQHINLLELMLVDHPAGMSVLHDKYGKLHTLVNPVGPEKATDLEGHDVRLAVAEEDNRLHLGNPDNANARAEDGLNLTFHRPAGAAQAKLILRARNSAWLDYAHESLQRELGEYGPKVRQKFLEKDSAGLQQWAIQQNIPLSVWLETAPGQWERKGFFNLAGAGILKRDVLPLDLSKVQGDQVHIKLTSGFLFWEIDCVALDFSPDQPLRTQVLPVASATDQEGRDLKELLRTDDNRYHIQPKTGDEARLSFPVIPAAPGMERSLVLHAKGHYQILRGPVGGKPSRRYLRTFTQPDAFPKYSRERWNALLWQEPIWEAGANQ